MDEVRTRIERELGRLMERLRQLGGAVVIEEFPDPVGDTNPPADPADQGQLRQEQELSFLTRSLLVERANRLAEALDRLEEGQYGMCEECGQPIAPARLRAMPEVTTCVRCQDRRERPARQLAGLTGGTAGGGPPQGGETAEALRRPPK